MPDGLVVSKKVRNLEIPSSPPDLIFSPFNIKSDFFKHFFVEQKYIIYNLYKIGHLIVISTMAMSAKKKNNDIEYSLKKAPGSFFKFKFKFIYRNKSPVHFPNQNSTF